MLPVNFNQLYYFWMVARRGTISGAAQRLLLNQSTISLQMKQLEAALGSPLLLRSRHGVELTEAGRDAFEYCDAIFSQAEEMLARLKEGGGAAAPRFRLGVSQSIPREKVLALSGHIRRLAPGTSVRIASRSSEELERLLERRRIDLVLSDLDLTVRLGREYRSRLAGDAPLFFVASPRLRLARKPFPSSLAGVPLLLRAPENPVRQAADDYLRRRGILPNVQAESENPDLLRTMAIAGEGAAVMDPRGIEQDLKQRRLVKLHRSPIGVHEKAWIITARPRRGSPAAAALVEGLMSAFSFD